ncbi:hypothetical protein [Gemmata sp. SH-PL17]|uniref:hypothetical protein n=1 Tax=Gemmata sp. SH-PL17 TaxID=1630693 RepID=UPI00138FACA4|nr:hypothetical protein [Gemmata sp. SH-PL17]
MLRSLDGDTGRKERVLAAAFCRHVDHLMTEARCLKLLDVAKQLSVPQATAPLEPSFLRAALYRIELCADGQGEPDELAEICELTDRLSRSTAGYYYACFDEDWGPFDHDLIATCEAISAVSRACCPRVRLAEVSTHAARAAYRARGGTEQKRMDPVESACQCNLIRDVFPVPPKWATRVELVCQSPTANALAGQMYESRDFDAMPILADALQDAGCADENILSHCRGPGPHVRGCWVVDLVLEKE